ncbi:hypothetical protein E2C01_004684 [Portunus trituberculatus]|uniref:Uncharacterized protein n=1 Tax=Portunus trituberculatus TaxID=210409 RepID=A0A5B7CQA6_PORTR|nr:hypothetical protein [Portunus trituberculatus]
MGRQQDEVRYMENLFGFLFLTRCYFTLILLDAEYYEGGVVRVAQWSPSNGRVGAGGAGVESTVRHAGRHRDLSSHGAQGPRPHQRILSVPPPGSSLIFPLALNTAY